MAADVLLTPLLVGMGLRELSVSTSQVARVKAAVRALNAADCRALWLSVQAEADAEAVLRRSKAMAEAVYPELLEGWAGGSAGGGTSGRPQA
jgi:phosphotransferase system enzyme I (PtsI)